MLFLHKNADTSLVHALNTGSNPKDNEDQYVLVTSNHAQKVGKAVFVLAKELAIDPAAYAPMLKTLVSWMTYTEHDQKQKTIYQMMTPEGMSERQKARKLANWRYYNNYIDLTLALYGEVLSQKNLALENKVAQAVLLSPKITFQMQKLAGKITAFAEETFTQDRDKLLQGAYKTLHKPCSWTEWKAGYKSLSTGELIPFLYDITMSFKKPFHWSEPPMDQGQLTKENMRINVSTPNEDFYWTSRARWAEVPIWAAPSYTAQLMLLVAQKAGATAAQLQSFAYAIYAYWNQLYPHSATPIHRMFEVMTTAREFGVPQEACDPKKMYIEAMKFTTTQLMSKL